MVAPPSPPSRIGRFRVLRQLGEGGMGVVYAAHDERLDRPVAVKVLHGADASGDLLREARAAARVRHPRACQIFEVDAAEDRPFLVMELLDGEPLSARLDQGPLEARAAIALILEVLEALQGLHDAGLVHRDLKPSNVFLTPHGVKLLDFGLACAHTARDDDTRSRTAGVVAGTPHYMAPEQARGAAVDARTDVFAAGIVLFEAVTGRRPFLGPSSVEVLHAVLHDHPPALGGSALLTALDRVVQRALDKAPGRRFDTARDMAAALRGVRDLPGAGVAPELRSLTRLAVLPFRMLRPDPEVDFLTLGLADAIGSSLATREGVVVRSPFVAAPVAEASGWDIRRVGIDLDADLALTGSLLRAGDRVRVGAQLIECASGRLSWSASIDGDLSDVFRLQDTVAREVLASLPLGGAGAPAASPRSAVAYRLFLRANQLAADPATWRLARDLYLESLREDATFAPAWAQVGRLHRVIGKYSTDAAARDEGCRASREALDRALALEPDLPAAHYFAAQLETDLGQTGDALRRLLACAARRRSDPDLFAGLTHVCRYAGLPEASLAAHDRAVSLDPAARTSVVYTHFVTGDHARVIATPLTANDQALHTLALTALGRRAEAVARLSADPRRGAGTGPAAEIGRALEAILEGRAAEAIARLDHVLGIGAQAAPPLIVDGEPLYFVASGYLAAGAPERALTALGLAVNQGYFCTWILEGGDSFRELRDLPDFGGLADDLGARARRAREVFVALDGPALLGVPEPRIGEGPGPLPVHRR